MATTLAKIQIRRGLLQDLPLLDPGELGYATDEQRLFIGNEYEEYVGTGVAGQTITTSNRIVSPSKLVIFVDEGAGFEVKQVNSYWTLSNREITFINAVPVITDTEGNVINNIRVGYNNEVEVKNNIRKNESIRLEASQTNVTTNFSFNISFFNTALIHYSLIQQNTNIMRTGTLQIITNGINVDISDVYNDLDPNSTGSGITFLADLSGGYLNLKYTNTSSNIANMYITYQLWNTSL